MELSCPACYSPHIQKLHYGRYLSATFGIAIGAIYGARSGLTLGTLAGPAGAFIGSLSGSVIGAINGAVSGCALGLSFGNILDSELLDNCECRSCGQSFNAHSPVPLRR